MLRRDRNHPCVVLYSIGNEIPNQLEDGGAKVARELVAVCHEEDPTRPATSACDQSHVSSRNGFMDALDIAGYNYIDRLYGEKTYAPERERFPHRLCLGTETSNKADNWLGVRDNDYVIGEFIWTGIDYLGEAHGFPRRGSGSGYLDLAGGRKPEYFHRAAFWSDAPVLQLFVLSGEKPELDWRPPPSFFRWNWPEGAQLVVRAATNCDEAELFLNGRSLGRHGVSRDACSSDWTVPFAPGVLSAIGYRDGKRVAEQELRTAGKPERLRIDRQAKPLPGDIELYEITVVDGHGIEVADATSEVTVECRGRRPPDRARHRRPKLRGAVQGRDPRGLSGTASRDRAADRTVGRHERWRPCPRNAGRGRCRADDERRGEGELQAGRQLTRNPEPGSLVPSP